VVAKTNGFQYSVSIGRKPGNFRVVTGIPILVRMEVARKNDGIMDS
jgi:hypothetical protein